jgi:hypothetical protein
MFLFVIGPLVIYKNKINEIVLLILIFLIKGITIRFLYSDPVIVRILPIDSDQSFIFVPVKIGVPDSGC